MNRVRRSCGSRARLAGLLKISEEEDGGGGEKEEVRLNRERFSLPHLTPWKAWYRTENPVNDVSSI